MAERPMNQEEVIFYRALEKDPSEREAYLKEECGEDQKLVDRVKALLDAYHTDDDFMGKPPFDPETTLETSPILERSGSKIDRYKLLEQIGEGGFGIVYLAEQEYPIKRQVALKIIKPGMDSNRIIARFEAERQALALLDHPNIAHIFEAGSTESGRPYFVMEFINGMLITDYCDHHRLKIEDRLKLFIQVCQAIQHAHQKGIIHRDIKPSNIVVSFQDGKPVPKVIDFGVAKAIGMPLTEKTLFTQQGQLVGTPEYMSPEQADLREKDIDTRTDIYSLGVVLYELLAGTLPFESKKLREAGYAAIQQIIKDHEPPRPSTKLSSLGEDAIKVAQNRHTELSSLVSSLHQELEWIPMMAIRKEREQRYQTASDLAEDIQNYVEGNPLKAGPESAKYRLHKFIRRHQGPVTAAAIIAGLIIVSLVIITALYMQSEKLKNETERQLYFKSVALADTSKVTNVKYARQLLDLCPVKLRGWEWQWLDSNLDQSLLTLTGHQRVVYFVCFSPDGKRIASSSVDHTIKIWDTGSGREIRTFNGNQGSVYSICFSPDGKRIASACENQTIQIWDADTGNEIRTLSGHQKMVTFVCFSPDGKWIASGSADTAIKLWDADTGREIRTLSESQDAVLSICFSPDSKWFVSGGIDKKIIIWETNTGNHLQTLTGHQSEIDSVCFSPDGKRIVSGSCDKTIKIWDADTGREIHTLSGHQGYVCSVNFSPDGKWLASGSSDTTIKLWDANTGREVRTLSGHQGSVGSVCFSSDGKRIASGSDDNTLKIWNVDSESQQAILADSPDRNIVPASSSPNGKSIAIGSADTTVKLYDVETRQEIQTFKGHEGEVLCVCFSPDGRRIASGSKDKTIIIWDVGSGCLIRSLSGHTDGVCSVRFSPDGRQLVSISFDDDTLILWDTDSGRQLQTFRCHWIDPAYFSPDGKQIIAGTDYGLIKIWDAQNSHEIRTQSGHQGWVYVVSFSPDGKQMASGCIDNAIKIWNAENGNLIRTLNGHQSAVYSICFSPDGRRIVSGSADNTLKMWDMDSGTPLLTLTGHQDGVALVFFSPDGKQIVSLGNDKTIRIWDSSITK